MAFGLLGAVLATIVPSAFSLVGSMPGLVSRLGDIARDDDRVCRHALRAARGDAAESPFRRMTPGPQCLGMR
jgi:hypothetical protein